MSRNFIALTVLVMAGTALTLAESSQARGAARGSGFGAVRPVMMAPRTFRPAAPVKLPGPSARAPHAHPAPVGHPARNIIRNPVQRMHDPVHAVVGAPFRHLERRHHHAYMSGWIYPVTTSEDPGYPGYIGIPYDPAETIPVYAPQPAIDPPPYPPFPPLMPRSSGARDENADACRSERVTVPAAEGEREITVVRC